MPHASSVASSGTGQPVSEECSLTLMMRQAIDYVVPMSQQSIREPSPRRPGDRERCHSHAMYLLFSFRASQLHITWWENNFYLASSWRNGYARGWHLTTGILIPFSIWNTWNAAKNHWLRVMVVKWPERWLGRSGNRKDAGLPPIHQHRWRQTKELP